MGGGAPPGGYPPGGQGGFGPPMGGYGPAGGGYGGAGPQFPSPGGAPKTDPLAIVSLVAGILSIPCCCCWFFGFPFPIAAIACGIIALGRIKKQPQLYSGTTLCYAGIACGVLGFLLSSGFHFTPYGHLFRHRYGGQFL